MDQETITRAEFNALVSDVREIKADVKELAGLEARVRLLEYRVGNSPTWQWMVERIALPLLLLGVGVAIGLLVP